MEIRTGDPYRRNLINNLTIKIEVQYSQAVWRIRDVYPVSRIRLFSIPDPGSELSPSRIPDPHKRF
jgi:hypothetical protein